ncbi:MAG: hypothetical protein QXL56_04505, partial [Candidatus Korarchaeum sp.]
MIKRLKIHEYRATAPDDECPEGSASRASDGEAFSKPKADEPQGLRICERLCSPKPLKITSIPHYVEEARIVGHVL